MMSNKVGNGSYACILHPKLKCKNAINNEEINDLNNKDDNLYVSRLTSIRHNDKFLNNEMNIRNAFYGDENIKYFILSEGSCELEDNENNNAILMNCNGTKFMKDIVDEMHIIKIERIRNIILRHGGVSLSNFIDNPIVISSIICNPGEHYDNDPLQHYKFIKSHYMFFIIYIIEIIVFMQRRKIFHNDINVNNIMINNSSDITREEYDNPFKYFSDRIKIIDFDLMILNNKHIKHYIDNPYYISPELFYLQTYNNSESANINAITEIIFNKLIEHINILFVLHNPIIFKMMLIDKLLDIQNKISQNTLGTQSYTYDNLLNKSDIYSFGIVILKLYNKLFDIYNKNEEYEFYKRIITLMTHPDNTRIDPIYLIILMMPKTQKYDDRINKLVRDKLSYIQFDIRSKISPNFQVPKFNQEHDEIRTLQTGIIYNEKQIYADEYSRYPGIIIPKIDRKHRRNENNGSNMIDPRKRDRIGDRLKYEYSKYKYKYEMMKLHQ